MKRLACYLADILKFSVQVTLEVAVGAIVFTLTIAIAAVLLYFILLNAIE